MKLRNTFHNTEVDVKMTREEMDRIEHAVYSGRATDAEKAKLRRIKRALCGHKGCTCSNTWGERY